MKRWALITSSFETKGTESMLNSLRLGWAVFFMLGAWLTDKLRGAPRRLIQFYRANITSHLTTTVWRLMADDARFNHDLMLLNCPSVNDPSTVTQRQPTKHTKNVHEIILRKVHQLTHTVDMMVLHQTVTATTTSSSAARSWTNIENKRETKKKENLKQWSVIIP